jgi:hypothetical protein
MGDGSAQDFLRSVDTRFGEVDDGVCPVDFAHPIAHISAIPLYKADAPAGMLPTLCQIVSVEGNFAILSRGDIWIKHFENGSAGHSSPLKEGGHLPSRNQGSKGKTARKFV